MTIKFNGISESPYAQRSGIGMDSERIDVGQSPAKGVCTAREMRGAASSR